MEHLAFSNHIDLTSLYLGPLTKSFHKTFVDCLSLYVCGVYQQSESYYICTLDYLGLFKKMQI